MRFTPALTWATLLLSSSLTLAQDPVQLDLTCSQLSDCPPTFCIGGGAIGSCTDGKCQCGSPQAAPEPTEPPKVPECFHQNAVPDQYTSAHCRCNLDGTTKTLAELTIEGAAQGDKSASCAYTSMPTGTENPITQSTATYTLPCRICEGVGGLEFHSESNCKAIPDCEIPGPSAVVFLSDADRMVSLGMALNNNDGKELGGKIAKALKGRCSEYNLDGEKTQGCNPPPKADEPWFDVADIDVVADEGYEPMTLRASIVKSQYNSTHTLNWLIEKVAGGLILAAQQNCGEVTYEEALTPGKSGCGENGSLTRRNEGDHHPSHPQDGFQIKKRVDPGGMTAMKPDNACKYKTTMCTGPRNVNAIVGRPSQPLGGRPADHYLNSLSVDFEIARKTIGKKFDNKYAQWACEKAVGGVGSALTMWMPTGVQELGEFAAGGTEGAVDNFQALALEVYCGTSPS